MDNIYHYYILSILVSGIAAVIAVIFNALYFKKRRKLRDADKEKKEGEANTTILPIIPAKYGLIEIIKGAPHQEWVLEHSITKIGRDHSADIHLDFSWVSKIQAIIEKVDNEFYIQDCGSKNGTLVNGGKIPVEFKIPLNEGDLIQMATISLKFSIVDISLQRV